MEWFLESQLPVHLLRQPKASMKQHVRIFCRHSTPGTVHFIHRRNASRDRFRFKDGIWNSFLPFSTNDFGLEDFVSTASGDNDALQRLKGCRLPPNFQVTNRNIRVHAIVRKHQFAHNVEEELVGIRFDDQDATGGYFAVVQIVEEIEQARAAQKLATKAFIVAKEDSAL